MKTKTTLLFLLICAFIKAQSISNITISSGGSYQNNGTNSLHITIGESVVGTITNNASIHQGFWSSSFSLETLDTTPLTELDTNLSISPNPAADILTITSNIPRNYMVTIYTTTGKKIRKFNLEDKFTNLINIDNLVSGLYLLTIKDPSSSFTKSIKFLKQ